MKAVIALGANIGEPKENLDLAIALLKEATEFLEVSSYYSTAPVGGPKQPDYLNAVCIVENQWAANVLNIGVHELLILISFNMDHCSALVKSSNFHIPEHMSEALF